MGFLCFLSNSYEEDEGGDGDNTEKDVDDLSAFMTRKMGRRKIGKFSTKRASSSSPFLGCLETPCTAHLSSNPDRLSRAPNSLLTEKRHASSLPN